VIHHVRVVGKTGPDLQDQRRGRLEIIGGFVWRWLQWKLALMRIAFAPFTCRPPPGIVATRTVHYALPEDFPPTHEPYVNTAAVWSAYAGWFVPNYRDLLLAAERYHRIKLTSVLDLACGTGLLTRQIAPVVESVVGIDTSEAMLTHAHAETSEPNVRYMEADFRSFTVDQTFDAVICGSDSINYLQSPSELLAVFGSVRRHLRPGGLFAFDVCNARTFAALSRIVQIGNVRGRVFEIYNFYDPETGICESRAVFHGAIERHRRIPIERRHVYEAATKGGLAVAEHFSMGTFLLMPFLPARQYYLLRRVAE
jgi:SAM-dependent methyltransferase